MIGYAVIHRSLIGHPAFRNDAESMAFAWLVLRASWEPARVRYKGKALALARGQLALSVRDFAEAMDRDKGWVERLLKRLKSETMIETRNETGVLVITICKYDEYQKPKDKPKTVRKTVDETPARQPQDTEQEGETGKKESPLTPLAGGEPGFVIDRWNAMAAAADLPQVVTFANDRKRKLEARLREHGMDRVFAAIDAVGVSPWCRGEGASGWHATFDFVLQPKSFAKLIEGGFAPKTQAANDRIAKPSASAETLTEWQELQRRKTAGEITSAEFFREQDRLRGIASQRNGATGPPRDIGELAARISQQAMH